MITKTDFAALLAYVEGLRDWIEAAAGCINSQRTFADSLNSFLRQR